MKDDPSALEFQGLQFFGKVSASLSHEIKNVLAIIGETSGLMEDLLAMHRDRGAPLDPQRLQSIAERIRKHVSRGDAIVKNMNQFAHSADEPVKVKDLAELAHLVVKLAERHATLRGVTLDFSSTDDPVPVETYPFLLQQLLWICIDCAVPVCGPSKKLSVQVGRANEGGRVTLGSLALPESEMRGLLRALETTMTGLGVQVSAGAEGKEVRLLVPRRLSAPGGA